MKHVLVKYGPVSKMNATRFTGFGAEPARIVCTVEGFPTPTVTFEKHGLPVSKKLLVDFKLLRGNIYQAVLNVGTPFEINRDTSDTTCAGQRRHL